VAELVKYIIMFTLPSGAQFAASAFDGKFALQPIHGNKIKKAISFESREKAWEWFHEFRQSIGEQQFHKLTQLKPRLLQITAEH